MTSLLSVVGVMRVMAFVPSVSLESFMVIFVVSLVGVSLLSVMIIMVSALVAASLLVMTRFASVVSVEVAVFGVMSTFVVVIVEFMLLVVVILVRLVVESSGLLPLLVSLLLSEFPSFVAVAGCVMFTVVTSLLVVSLVMPTFFAVVSGFVFFAVFTVTPFVVVMGRFVSFIALVSVARVMVTVVRRPTAFFVTAGVTVPSVAAAAAATASVTAVSGGRDL